MCLAGTAIFIFIDYEKISLFAVIANGDIILVGKGNKLFVGLILCRLAFYPVVTIGCSAEYKFAGGDGLHHLVQGLFNKSYGGNASGSTFGVVFIVSHQKYEVIIVRNFRYIQIIVGWIDIDGYKVICLA